MSVENALKNKKLSALEEYHYLQWIQAYMNYHDGRHPILMGRNELKSYLLYLEYKLHLPMMTIRHAFYALEYLYTKILGTTIPRFEELNK